MEIPIGDEKNYVIYAICINETQIPKEVSVGGFTSFEQDRGEG